MRIRFSVLAVALVSFGLACSPSPVEAKSPDDDVGATTPAGRACKALEAVDCPEAGKDPRTSKSCYQRLTSEAELAKIPFDCVIAAKTQDAVRACGSKDTIRFRCRTGDGG